MYSDLANKYGRIELHLHLDGSLSNHFVFTQAKRQGIRLPVSDEKDLTAVLSVDAGNQSLAEYLKKFDIPLMLLQKEDALPEAVCDVMRQLRVLGVIYAEIRFAPQLHTRDMLTQEDAVRACIKGLMRGMEETGVRGGLILCLMRGDDNFKENMETLHLAEKYLGEQVLAVDLAGAEGRYKTKCFRELFSYAKEKKIPFTIHAGEADGADSVRDAIMMGAKRIGHGVRAIEDEAVMELLANKGIPLEMCPSSNLQTKAISDLHKYPLREYLRRGISVTINSDNMTVSHTNIKKEFDLLKEGIGLTEEEAKQLYQNAVSAAFSASL